MYMVVVGAPARWFAQGPIILLRQPCSPWPRQIITPILSTVKMLSLGCERLPTPLKKKKKKKVLDHYLHHDLGMLPLLRCFFAHLLILQYPDHHQNLISSYLYYSGPVHKISSQSVHNFLSNVHRQTNRQTNATKKHNLLCQGGKNIVAKLSSSGKSVAMANIKNFICNDNDICIEE